MTSRGLHPCIRSLAGSASPIGFTGHDGTSPNLKLTFHWTQEVTLFRRSIGRIVAAFGRKLEGADLARVLLYRGWAAVGGTNDLVPTDAKLKRSRDLALDAVEVLTVLGQNEARINLIFLDVCRDTPYARSHAGLLGARSRGLPRSGAIWVHRGGRGHPGCAA